MRRHVFVCRGIDFTSFYDFDIWLWNCCDSVVYLVLELLRQCGIFGFGTVVTVGYIWFWNCYDSVIYFALELLRQCGIFGFGTVVTVWYIWFWNC